MFELAPDQEFVEAVAPNDHIEPRRIRVKALIEEGMGFPLAGFAFVVTLYNGSEHRLRVIRTKNLHTSSLTMFGVPRRRGYIRVARPEQSFPEVACLFGMGAYRHKVRRYEADLPGVPLFESACKIIGRFTVPFKIAVDCPDCQEMSK